MDVTQVTGYGDKSFDGTAEEKGDIYCEFI